MELQTILDAIQKLSEKISSLKPQEVRPSRSEDLKDLFTALAKAQAEMQTAGLKSNNPYFKSKYADLAEIVRVSRPALTKHGLSVIQQIEPNEDGQNILHTILAHLSGQWIESRMRILPSKPDVQSLASYITYLRRYSYAALCGIVASDEDDDGEVAVATDRELFAKGTALNTKYNPREESYDTITREQMDELEYELAEFPDIAQQILEGLKIQNISDMPKTKYSASIRRVREIKNIRNGIK